MKTFKHSGDLGDLIYALPTVRALGGGVLYLSLDMAEDFARFELRGFSPRRYPIGPRKCDGTASGLSAASFAAVMPLLLRQPYIQAVERWRGETVDYDLNEWRLQKADFLHESIAVLCARRFGIAPSVVDTAWLTVDGSPERRGNVVFARSARYLHPGFPWPHYLRTYGARAVFAGLPEEHRAFEAKVGEIRYFPTPDLLALAELIARAELVVANQSLPYAIAEGLKVRVIQETSPEVPNCIFKRPGAISGLAWWERTPLWKVKRRISARWKVVRAASP